MNKMDCFYTAQNVITSNIENENKIIMMEYKANIERSRIHNIEMPPRPTLKTLDVDDIIKLAECIAQYNNRGSALDNTPPKTSLLTE